jgi:hypothetical protein
VLGPLTDGSGTRILALPVAGEHVCGDAWENQVNGRVTVMLADGLGHGPDAHRSAEEARRVFRLQPAADLAALLADMHSALKPTRGAALAVVRIDGVRGEVSYAGVGNITGVVLSDASRRSLVFQSGTVGSAMPRVRTGHEALPAGDVLILHTDGASARWSTQAYPGLLSHHPALIAGVLFRDFRQVRDDATVVACRVEKRG